MRTTLSALAAAFVFCLLSVVSHGQAYNVSGAVVDTFNNSKLENATLVLLRSRDSAMVDFTRADAQGRFTLKADTSRRFMLLVSFPGMADYVDLFQLDAPGTKDLGNINMVSRKNLLNEFIVRQRQGSIKIKGDTTEYLADSFLVREGANVDELLKKLPGITVDKNGQVTAQGEKVQKILVDGEEFFSDDPAVVTKNLAAKVVESVQVYDAQSDAAQFTGIDDGVRTKTINLKLKEDMKRGAFGKITVGAGQGTDPYADGQIKPVDPNQPFSLGKRSLLRNGYFENQGMLNAFKGKRQLSAFGIAANTGRIGLSWQDERKFSGDDGGFIMGGDDGEDGDMFMRFSTVSSDDDEGGGFNGGSYGGEGIPAAWNGGLHFANKWGKNYAQHLSANYRFSRRNVDAIGNTLTQYVLPGDSSYYNDQRRQSFSSNDRHGADALYEYKIDSLTTIKVNASGNLTNSVSNSRYHTEVLTGDGDAVNINNRTTRTETDGQSARGSVSLRRKFKKKGRSLIVEARGNTRSSDAETYLQSDITGSSPVPIAFDQRKITETNSSSVTGSVNYTEPITKTLFAELNYQLSLNDNHSRRITYNRTGSQPGSEGYSAMDSVLSSDYQYNVTQHQAGAGLRFVKGKWTVSGGGGYSVADFNQRDLLRDSSRDRKFENFIARATVRYKLSQMSAIFFSYKGNTSQPSIDQIQPIVQNTDPLNLTVGNPQLGQEFDHTFQLRYNDYKVITGRYVYLGSYASVTQNAITRVETILPGGFRTYQYVNLSDRVNYNTNLYFGGGQEIRKITGLRIGLNGNINLNQTNNIINGQDNRNLNNTYGVGLNINYDKEKKFNIGYDPNFVYNYNNATISTQITSYWTMDHNLNASVELPKKFQIGTDVNWSIRQKTEQFTQRNNVFVWNAYVSKKFLKKDNVELRAAAFDILNQNLGFTRYANANTVTQNRYNTVRRYGMLSLIWNFTYTPKGAAKADEGPNLGDMIINKQ